MSFASPAHRIRLCVRAPLSRAFFTLIRSLPPVYFHESTDLASLNKISLSPDPNALPMGYTSLSPQSGFIPVTKSEAADFTSEHIKKVDEVIPPPQKYSDEPGFIKLLAQVGAESFHQADVYKSIAEGEVFREGTTLHIYDLRDPPPYGRIPLVQDIVGMVRIQSPDADKGVGPIIAKSFEYNPMYRPLSMNGFINVGDFVNDKLRKACEAQKV